MLLYSSNVQKESEHTEYTHFSILAGHSTPGDGKVCKDLGSAMDTLALPCVPCIITRFLLVIQLSRLFSLLSWGDMRLLVTFCLQSDKIEHCLMIKPACDTSGGSCLLPCSVDPKAVSSRQLLTINVNGTMKNAGMLQQDYEIYIGESLPPKAQHIFTAPWEGSLLCDLAKRKSPSFPQCRSETMS